MDCLDSLLKSHVGFCSILLTGTVTLQYIVDVLENNSKTWSVIDLSGVDYGVEVCILELSEEYEPYQLYRLFRRTTASMIIAFGDSFRDSSLFRFVFNVEFTMHDRIHLLSKVIPKEDFKDYETIEYMGIKEIYELIRRVRKGKAIDKELVSSVRKSDRRIEKVLFTDIRGHSIPKLIVRKLLSNPHGSTFNIRGIILHGKPGTGKTMFAKAISNEFQIPFLSVSCAELIHSKVGESEHSLHSVFKKLKTKSVLFIDEIDTLFGIYHRLGPVSQKLLCQFLNEMDNLRSDSLVIGATNYINLLDDSLFVNGRFDLLLDFDRE